MPHVAAKGQAHAVLVLVGFVCLALAGLIVALAFGLSVHLGTFFLLLLSFALAACGLGMMLYAWSFAHLAYWLDRNGIVIRLPPLEFVLPAEEIKAVRPWALPQGTGQFLGLRLPGHNVGLEGVGTGKPTLYLSTRPPDACLYVETGSRLYGLSPADAQEFLRQWELARQLGPRSKLMEGVRLGPPLRSLLLPDRLALEFAGVAWLLGLLLLAAVFALYPGLPGQVPLHFDALGRPDWLLPSRQIFYLPFIGAVVVAINSLLAVALHRRERLLAYYLWAGAALVQVLLFIALRAIVRAA